MPKENKRSENTIPSANKNFLFSTGPSINGKIPYLNGKSLTSEQKSQLQGEAAQFKQTLLYQILIETPKYEAQNIIFNLAKDFQDVLNGKNILHVVQVQEKIMKFLE